ncbi:MAG: DUF1080 domain-containing protein [Armatimonadetes bacterium]|nr:DUF1080 domain-containing protein [Armatimonadota bacterium]
MRATVCWVIVIFTLLAVGVATAAEIGRLEGAPIRGIGLYADEEAQFTLQPQAVWGGYSDQRPQPLRAELLAVLRTIPVGGYHRETWRLSSPYGDHFSARFTGTLKVEKEGDYTFYFQSDDGARVWIDDKQIIDAWVPRSNVTSEATIALTAGDHAVRCEYMEIGGGAQAHFRWKGPGFDEQVVPASAVTADGQPGWKADYFLNEELKGEPRTTHEPVIDINWGDGGPEVYGGGPPIAEMDSARVGEDYVIGQLRGPETAYIGVVVQPVGSATMGYDVWANDLVAYGTGVSGQRPAKLRLRPLTEGATFDIATAGRTPAVWAPGKQPLLFMAGLGDLPKLTAAQAREQLQKAMLTGLNAPFPELSKDGWAYLFNGRNLNKWRLRNPNGPQSWSVENGELVNAGHGTDLISDFPLTDCQLHVEFSVPKDSNSGVYLQGRYEVQVHDSFGLEVADWTCGSIYGQAVATQNVCKPADEWQSFDITFRGARPSLDGDIAKHARITVVQNGVKIVDNAELSGVTGGALDADEIRAQGIFLQGDHGVVRYRNIKVRPLG